MHRSAENFPSLKALDISNLDMDDAFAHERVQSLLDFASLTDLVLPYVPEINDWKIVAEALSASTTLKKVTYFGRREGCWLGRGPWCTIVR